MRIACLKTSEWGERADRQRVSKARLVITAVILEGSQPIGGLVRCVRPFRRADVTAMQLYCLQMTRLAEQGRLGDTLAGLGKFHNTTRARAVLAEARDLSGGNGILLDCQLIKTHSRPRGHPHVEGTDTIQALIVGRDITGFSAFA